MKRSLDPFKTVKEILRRITTLSECNMAIASLCQLRQNGERELRWKYRTPEEKSERKAKFKREYRLYSISMDYMTYDPMK